MIEDRSGVPLDYDHYDPAIAADPSPVWARLRDSCPVAPASRHGGFWAVSTYRDVYDVVHDPATFSSAKGNVIPMLQVERPMIPLHVDPPAHHSYRRILQPWFSPRRMRRLESEVREITVTLLDSAMDEDECDLAEAVAWPLPAIVIARIIDLPTEHHPQFQAWSEAIVRDAHLPDVARVSASGLYGYFGALLAERRSAPGDDFVSFLTTASFEGRSLRDEEILDICFLLLLAGHETTANNLTLALHFLARRPDLQKQLRKDPGLIPLAVEELLRYEAGFPGSARTVTTATVLRDVPLDPDDRVMVLWGSANRDPEEFPDPDQFIVDRHPNRHLSFGAGIHRCLGAPVARLEFRVLLEELLSRCPNFELAAPESTSVKPGITWGMEHLPVRWVSTPATAIIG